MLYKQYQFEPAPDEPLEYSEYRLTVGLRTVLWFSVDTASYLLACDRCGVVSGNYRGLTEALYTVETDERLSMWCPRCQTSQWFYECEGVALHRWGKTKDCFKVF